jgi:oligosaccharide translocation protein RFT1
MDDAALLAGAGVPAAAAPPAAAAGAAVMGVFKYNFGECASVHACPLLRFSRSVAGWLMTAGCWDLGSNARCCFVSAAQFLSRVIPFVFNIWFVRHLGADDGAVSV